MDFTDNREIEQIKYIESDKNQFSVMGSLTTWCNYKCPYCCQSQHDLKMRPEIEIIASAKKINMLIKECHDKPLMLTLLGGEITYYNLIKILDEFNCNITKLVLTTNFSQRLSYFKELYNYCKDRKIGLQMMCSYHETGDDFFLKYLELTKWCTDNDNPPPILSFVMDNDFDFGIFDRFPNIPRSLINVNLKQIDTGFVKLTPEVNSKWKALTVDKYKWCNNEVIKPMLQKRKEQKLWWYHQEFGYEVIYNNGEKVPLSNLKALLMCSPRLLYSETKACNALYSNLVIDAEDNIQMCSSYPKVLSNLNTFTLDDYKNQLHNPANLICSKVPCALCHTANIYKNLKMLLDNEPLIKENMSNELQRIQYIFNNER